MREKITNLFIGLATGASLVAIGVMVERGATVFDLLPQAEEKTSVRHSDAGCIRWRKDKGAAQCIMRLQRNPKKELKI